MSTGLLALLDDVSALVKAGAASLDDIPAQVAKSTGKVGGIIIDDAAVTPKYVVGLDSKRELSIIYNIAKQSIINKLLYLGPATLLLGYFLPAIINPILMIGGTFLCIEGFHKVYDYFKKSKKVEASEALNISPEELEKMRVGSAIRTDFILSAEIMAITYSTLVGLDVLNQIIVMFIVAIGVTVLVYGTVGIIVKMDDVGFYMIDKFKSGPLNSIGKFIIKFMPYFLKALSFIGTLAMLLVGFEIIIHNIHIFEKFYYSLPKYIKYPGIIASGVAWGAIFDLLSKPIINFFKNRKKAKS